MPGFYGIAEGDDLFMPDSESWPLDHDEKSCVTGRERDYRASAPLRGLMSSDCFFPLWEDWCGGQSGSGKHVRRGKGIMSGPNQWGCGSCLSY